MQLVLQKIMRECISIRSYKIRRIILYPLITFVTMVAKIIRLIRSLVVGIL